MSDQLDLMPLIRELEAHLSLCRFSGQVPTEYQSQFERCKRELERQQVIQATEDERARQIADLNQRKIDE